MLSRIHQAIKDQDRKTLEQYLTDQHLAYFLQQDPNHDGNTSLHIAIAKQNVDAVILILHYLKQQPEFAKHISMTNYSGTNILHFAAMHSTFHFLQILIDQLGDEAVDLARRANNYYLLPVDVANNVVKYLSNMENTNNADKQQNEMQIKNKKLCHDLLLKTAHLASVKKLSVKLDSNEVFARYPEDKDNTNLRKNIDIGCEILNYARSVITGSTTHPRYHHYSPIKRRDIDDRCEKARGSRLRILRGLDTRAEYIARYKAGNCWEYAQLCMYKARRIRITSSDYFRVEYCQLTGRKENESGRDHVVIIMGRAPTATDDPQTWGPDAIIIDAWSGLIYRPHEIAKYFMDFYLYYTATPVNNETRHILTVPYNPAVHQFQVFSGWLYTRMGNKDVPVNQITEWDDKSDTEDEIKSEPSLSIPKGNIQSTKKIVPFSIDDEKSVETESSKDQSDNHRLFGQKRYVAVKHNMASELDNKKCCLLM